ncbi:hypothetical protein Ocin01_06562 [Orchesella cincta]|uniref:Uncharacterized protein n=1 Tax=Orchesella cincta TaxID=48709 RepID=A0A1D2N4A5_ORCCI|nr:hypothetical protein Ocin01_06562 [Orchesella cincta]
MASNRSKTILLVCIYSMMLTLVMGANLGGKQIEFRDDDPDDDDDDWTGWNDETELSDGAIVAIAIAVIGVIFGIPILLCFCCAWCCFRGRKNKTVKTQIVAVTAPSAPQPQYQQQQPTLQPVSSNVPIKNYNSVSPIPPLASTSSSAYPVQQYGANYNRNSDVNSHIYEQPPPYYDMAMQHQHEAQGQPSTQEIGWTSPKS